MFKFNQLKQIHLEITNNCQASCPMCNRNINGGLTNPLIKIRHWSLQEFKTVMSTQVLQQIDSYYFCGNFGDPIMNNDLIDMCRYSTSVAPAVRISIHTNGSARPKHWWQDLAESLPSEHSVVFALDGLEDTHAIYRIGTNFTTIIQNAQAFINAGGTAEWVFIRFRHNEHQVESAKQMAQQLGFKKFTIKNSSRFVLEPRVNVVDKHGNLTHYIEPATEVTMKYIDKKIIQGYRELVEKSVIDCKVQNDKEVYIDAHGDLFPCCWIASVPYSYIPMDDAHEVRHQILQQHTDLVNRLGPTNALTKSIKDIIDSNEYQTVWQDYWTTNKLITCARTCGINTDFAKPRDQIV